jgi:hypothetical protein
VRGTPAWPFSARRAGRRRWCPCTQPCAKNKAEAE